MAYYMKITYDFEFIHRKASLIKLHFSLMGKEISINRITIAEWSQVYSSWNASGELGSGDTKSIIFRHHLKQCLNIVLFKRPAPLNNNAVSSGKPAVPDDKFALKNHALAYQML